MEIEQTCNRKIVIAFVWAQKQMYEMQGTQVRAVYWIDVHCDEGDLGNSRDRGRRNQGRYYEPIRELSHLTTLSSPVGYISMRCLSWNLEVK